MDNHGIKEAFRHLNITPWLEGIEHVDANVSRHVLTRQQNMAWLALADTGSDATSAIHFILAICFLISPQLLAVFL